MKNFDYSQPKTAAQACASLGQGAVPKAGGTDLLPLMKHRIKTPEKVTDLLGVEGLTGILERGDHFEIGATTILADVADHPDLGRLATCVSEAARKTATPLVRNRATVGGNLAQRPRCWYFRHPDYPCAKKGGDTCFAAEGENKYHAIFENVTCNIVHPSNLAPALWAMDAEVVVHNAQGERTIPIAEFWVIPELDMSRETVLEDGDLITKVRFAKQPKSSGSCYLEVREKQSYDWALVSAAARLDRDGDKVKDARLVISAVAPTPLRREAAEEVLRGQRFTEELAAKAGLAACEGATPLRDNGYKVRMLAACVKHALITAWQKSKS